MAEESGGFTLGWATKIGIVLEIIGGILQHFARGLAEQFAPLALQPFEAVLWIYLVLAFISNAFGEEKEFGEIIKQSLPLVFIYGIMAWFLSANMGMVFLFIFVLFLVPLFGGAMRRMSTEGGLWKAWKAAKEGQKHPILGVLAE